MAETTSMDSPLIQQLASQMVANVADFFEGITAGEARSLDQFPYDADNFLYVVYSGSGMPIAAGVVAGEHGKREGNRFEKKMQEVGAAVPGSTVRVVELGNERLANSLGRLVSDLFGSVMPIPMGAVRALGEPAGDGDGQAEAPAVRRRGRRPGSKSKPAPSNGRRRRRGTGAAAEGAVGADGTETAAPTRGRRGGRRPGAGRKPASAADADKKQTGPRRRGRRPRNAEAGGATVSEIRNENLPRRGRPRRNAVVADETSAPRRRGRPRKNPIPVEAEAPRKRGPGRPRKNP